MPRPAEGEEGDCHGNDCHGTHRQARAPRMRGRCPDDDHPSTGRGRGRHSRIQVHARKLGWARRGAGGAGIALNGHVAIMARTPGRRLACRMIIGHLGVAFAARSRWPRLSVYWLVVATLAPDLFRAALAAGGMSMGFTTRYSHLLPWSAYLALVLGAVAYAVYRTSAAAVVTAVVVLSHIALDFVSGAKALWDGSLPGLDAQRYMQLEFVIEAAICWWGWRMMRRSPAPTWMSRRSVLAGLLVFEALFQAWRLEQRPYASRCWVWPVESCWEWRGEKPPGAEVGM